MALIVQKYGGSSLADVERLRNCAARVVGVHLDGHQVVVVVSAMGRTTDDLLELANRVAKKPARRELDRLLVTGEQVSAALMAMAIDDLGVPVVSRAAGDLGIVTDPVHGQARIRSIDANRIRVDLAAGQIVVVPGFQGVTRDGDITTFGRGGSDTTAVALAAALGVGSGDPSTGPGRCEILTDVDGVYTADPNIVTGTRKLDRISCEEMVELASLGAGVLHTRAVMCGQRFGVPIHVRHSVGSQEGTLIVKETPDMESVSIVGCALTPDLGRVSIRGLLNRPGVQADVFSHISEASILIDDIMQIESGADADVSFTVDGACLGDLKLAVGAALDEIGAGSMSVDVGLAKISAVGVGMRSHTGVATTMFRALGDAGINIANITTSEIKISCLVPAAHGPRALQVVHDAFGLGSEPGEGATQTTEPKPERDRTRV